MFIVNTSLILRHNRIFFILNPDIYIKPCSNRTFKQKTQQCIYLTYMYFDNGLNSTPSISTDAKKSLSFSTLFPKIQVSILITSINFRGKGEVGINLCKDLMIMKSQAGKAIFKFCSFSSLVRMSSLNLALSSAGSFSGEAHEASMTRSRLLFYCKTSCPRQLHRGLLSVKSNCL